MSTREELLRAIAADPRSTDSERSAAQKELKHNEVTQNEDIELERFLASRNVSRQQWERRELRKSLSPALQQLLNDICEPSTLMIVPDSGSESRLQALLKRTKSDIVTRYVLASLTNIKWLASVKTTASKGPINAPAA
jgi:hypothetical protein